MLDVGASRIDLRHSKGSKKFCQNSRWLPNAHVSTSKYMALMMRFTFDFRVSTRQFGIIWSMGNPNQIVWKEAQDSSSLFMLGVDYFKNNWLLVRHLVDGIVEVSRWPIFSLFLHDSSTSPFLPVLGCRRRGLYRWHNKYVSVSCYDFLNEWDAEVDLVLIQTSFLFLWKLCL